ncbi:MAG: LysR family transcriptional regulator [Cellvibrionaceae bacterium]
MADIKGLNWNDLKFFHMVARYGALMEASDRLNVNHSTVFRRINTLEKVLGVKLFDRTSDGYQLSKTGLEAHEYVERIADAISDIHRLVDNTNNKLQGDINLTAPHNFAYRYLPNIISRFQQEYPDIHVNLLVTNKDCDLSKREADLAIRASSSPPEHLIGVKLFSFRWSVYASEAYISAHGRPNDESDLQEHRVISVHQDLEYLPAFRWVHRNIPDDNIVSRCNDLMSISALALEGVGLAILPDDQNKPGLEKLFEVDFAKQSDIWVLHHPNLRDCLRLKTFKRYLIDSLNSDPDILSNVTVDIDG